jgi:para-nitrobenzyl esterase
MKKFLIVFAILAGILAISLGDELSAAAGLGIVKTKFGSVWGVSGKDYKTVTIFKGIPYAAPPVGNLRWKPPQDPKPWDGIKVCDTYAAASWMDPYFDMNLVPGNTYWQFYATGKPTQSEDCLYLNVATPAATGNEKLPVMIWFHGGGFNRGWSYEVEMNPEALANKGVIVVSVGTRLGILGFLSLPQLSAESSYKGSGNYGLMDCSKAIQWVHDNIQGFGGDPDNLTVFGQSGGSGKTTAVLISPLSRKLIKNTINQSALGAFGKYKMLKEAETAGLALLKSKGIPENISTDELRKIDIKILNADWDVRSATGGFVGAVIDGYYLLESPVDFYLGKGNLEGKNMMFGNVFGEGGTFKATTAKELYAELKTKYGALYDKYKLDEALQLTDGNTAYYRHALSCDEGLMNSRIYAEVNAKLNKTCKTFVYTFGHVTPGADWGWHTSELWYVFGSLRRDTDYQPKWTFFDDLTAEVLSSYWSNFAKKGDPNDYGLSRWPQGGNLGYMFLDGMSYSKGEPLSPWEKLLREYAIQKNGLEKILQ